MKTPESYAEYLALPESEKMKIRASMASPKARSVKRKASPKRSKP